MKVRPPDGEGGSYDLGKHISSSQRFRGDRRCPICNGTEDEPRGQGRRCIGFLSSDGLWAHCSRDEHAGLATMNPGSQCYQHILKGRCPCGTEHAPSDPKPRKPRKRTGTIDRTYPYVDLAGILLYEVVRYRDPKDFRQRRPDGKGGWTWNLQAAERILFRLPELAKADPAEVVVIVEGEKDVERLRSLGFVATCNSGGAGKWRESFAEHLRGRRVAIIPDNDPPGLDHANKVARTLAGIAAEAKIVELPELPDGGDASDFLDRGGTAEDLRALVAAAPLWTADGGPGKRPAIKVTVEAHQVIDAAVDAIAADPDVFQRANALVRVVRDPLRAKAFRRPPGSPRIAPIPTPTLMEKLTRFAEWTKWRKADGWVPTLPPDWLIGGVSARADWPKIRPLEGVIESPSMRPDGTIIDRPGYDEATGLLYVPNAVFPAVPDRPTPDHARRAAAELMDLVTNFPFACVEGEAFDGGTHSSAWLACVLTAVARFAIDGPCPLTVFDATTPGAGKTLLADLVALIATARPMARTAYPDNDDEMRKRITSVALAGDRLMLIDNVAATFGSSSLDAALTGTTWQDRILCKSEMTPELPLFTVWCASGNNVQFKGDLLRRIVHCRLEPEQERPEERDPSTFAIKEPLPRYVLSHRPRLVASALTILRAYVVAGRPHQKLTPFGTFEAWSDLVRSAIHWAVGEDPCRSRANLTATDSESADRGAIVEGWAELPGSERGLTTSEALKLLKANPDHFATLRAVITNRSGDLMSPRSLGMKLHSIRGRFVGCRCLRSFSAGNNTLAWKVEGPGVEGTNGTKGTNSTPRAENSEGDAIRKNGASVGNRSPQSPQSPGDEFDWSE